MKDFFPESLGQKHGCALYKATHTIRVLEENIGSKISDVPHNNIFAHISLRTKEIRETINKWYYIKLKKLLLG